MRAKGHAKTKPPAERLADLISRKLVIAFQSKLADKEYPYINCSIWGAIPRNELFVRLANGKESFVRSCRSELDFPVMADRVFGMDAVDANVAYKLAERMWKAHKSDLIVAQK